MTDPLNIAHYFVDEAGDTTLFNRRGKVIVGSEGVSHLFMIGVGHLPNPRQKEQWKWRVVQREQSAQPRKNYARSRLDSDGQAV